MSNINPTTIDPSSVNAITGRPYAGTGARNLQAQTTLRILNAVRLLGTGAFALLALLLAVVGLVEWAGPNTNGTAALLMTVGLGAAVVSGALFYAIVGWFVDTLSLLKQIAER